MAGMNRRNFLSTCGGAMATLLPWRTGGAVEKESIEACLRETYQTRKGGLIHCFGIDYRGLLGNYWLGSEVEFFGHQDDFDLRVYLRKPDLRRQMEGAIRFRKERGIWPPAGSEWLGWREEWMPREEILRRGWTPLNA